MPEQQSALSERVGISDPTSQLRHTLPISQRVYLTLRRMLTVGGFRPGEGVSLRMLAKRLGTSAMPVREAVNRLIAEQALQMLPKRQVIVPRMTRRKFAELSRVRQLLEGEAAAAACENIHADLLAELDRIHGELLDALAADETAQILQKNRDFHFTLYEAGRCEILMPMIEGLWMQAGPFQAVSLSEQKRSWTATQHAAVLVALRGRDRDGVISAIQHDIGNAAELLMQIGVFDE
jgi:DNA-binding GntR family transcriptional regulator